MRRTTSFLIRFGTAAWIFLSCLAVVPWGTASELPRVHLLATGGTIAAGSQGSLSSSDLLERLPALKSLARITTEDFSRIGSSRMTPELQFRLAQRVNALYQADPDLAGVVITHGTDSLEETAFFLDLMVQSERPVVFAAAQRAPREPDSDGGRNLLNAVRLAVSPAARGAGVLVTLNDQIHAARDVRKTHTISLDAFQAPGTGPLGYLDGERVYLARNPARRLTLSPAAIEPHVDLLTLVAGSDGHLVRAATDSGAKGIVVEVFGRGNAPPAVLAAVEEALDRQVVVVFTSRTRGGRVEIDERLLQRGILTGEDLDGLKARMLLIAVLGDTKDRETIQSYFKVLAGEMPNPEPPERP